MLRSLHLPIISFCILLTVSNCNNGCETSNALLGERVIKLETELTRTIKAHQELGKQLGELDSLQNAIFQAKAALDQLMPLKEELEQKLAELQAARAPQSEIEAIRQRLEKVEQDIVNKNAEIKRLEVDVKKAQSTANTATQRAATAQGVASQAQQGANKANVAAGKAQKTADDLKIEFESFKNGLQLQINGLQAGLKACAKITDLDPIKGNIGQLQKDIEEANKKLAKAATQDELKLAKQELDGKISGVQRNLTAVQKALQEEIVSSKTKAVEEAKQIAAVMVRDTKQEMKKALQAQVSLLATKQELEDAIKKLNAPQEVKNELEKLQQQMTQLANTVSQNASDAKKEFEKVNTELEALRTTIGQNKTEAKTRADELQKVAQENSKKADDALQQLQALKKQGSATEQQIKQAIEELSRQKAAAEKAINEFKLKAEGLSTPNQFNQQAYDKVIVLEKDLQGIRAELNGLRTTANQAEKLGRKTVKLLSGEKKSKGTLENLFAESEQQPPVPLKPKATSTSPSSPEFKGSDLDPYKWTNGEARTFKDKVIALEEQLDLLSKRITNIQVNNSKKSQGYNESASTGYEARLKPLEEELSIIKEKEQAAKGLDEGIKRLTRLLESFKRGSFRITNSSTEEGSKKALSRSGSRSSIEGFFTLETEEVNSLLGKLNSLDTQQEK